MAGQIVDSKPSFVRVRFLKNDVHTGEEHVAHLPRRHDFPATRSPFGGHDVHHLGAFRTLRVARWRLVLDEPF